MSSGNNTASVSISPNFSNNNLTLNGNIVPLTSQISSRTFLVIRIQESIITPLQSRKMRTIVAEFFFIQYGL
jgi:hypothetical protein